MGKTVKSVTVIKKDVVLPSVSANELTENEYLFSKTEYNEKGQILKEINYHPDGSIEHAYSYNYDDNGFLKEEMLIENKDEVIERTTFEPDEKMNIRKEYRHYLDGTYDSIEYICDDNGNLVEKVTIDYEGGVELRECFEFKGEKLIKETVLDKDNKVISEKTIKYDDKDRITDTESYDSLEETRLKRITEYDDKGYPKELLTYDLSDRLIERIQFSHNDDGRLAQVIEENPRKKNTIKFQYDKNGNVVCKEEFDKNGKLINKVERIYDDDSRVLEARAFIEIAEKNIIRNYVLTYDYEFYD